MATIAENLQTAIENTAEQLATMSAALSATTGEVISYGSDGQTTTRQAATQMRSSLIAELDRLFLLQQKAESPIEVITYGVV